MNERIEALKKLATKEVWGNNPYNGSPEFDGYELDADMFAELIVRECVQVCADRGTHHDGLYSAWADDCSKRIGKHFGVEE